MGSEPEKLSAATPDDHGAGGTQTGLADGAAARAQRARAQGDSPGQRPSGGKAWLWVLLALLIAAAAIYFLFFKPGENAQPANNQMVTVGVAKVVRRDMYNEVPIPAEFRPYVQSQLHAIVTCPRCWWTLATRSNRARCSPR